MNSAAFHAIDAVGSGTPVAAPRKGPVRADGRQFVDDVGAFYPYGGSLFWGPRGYLYERPRMQQNQAYLAKSGCNVQRNLVHVNWLGNESNWREVATEPVLGGFLDESWGKFNLRSSLTLLGSAVSDEEALEICRRVADIVSSRMHTIQQITCANEAAINHISLSTCTLMAHALRQAGYTGLLALTAAEELYSGVSWNDVRNGALLGGGVNLLVGHPDRGQGDDGCHALRQFYDWRDMPGVIDGEEPIGPLSSVAECSDPLQLAMLCAMALAHGVHSFILHNAAGVFGQIDPMHGRPANLWETPNIDAIMAAVRNVYKFMPVNAGTGTHYNNEAPNPFRVKTIWPKGKGPDDVGYGANRRYCVEYPWGFICPTFGMVAPSEYVCRDAAHVEAFDPVLGGVVQAADLHAGESITLEPSTLDHAGHGALIVKGNFL